MKPPRTDGICSDCEKPIPLYMVNPGGVGYVSPLSDQLPGSIKEAMLLGTKAWEAIPRQVCMACYCLAWNELYPDNPCPLQEQSDFIHADLDRAFRLGLVMTTPIVIQEPISAPVGENDPEPHPASRAVSKEN